MKVGVVTTSYPREPGDPAGAFVAGFARWLAGQGHEVDVVALAPGLEGAPERLAQAGAGVWARAAAASAQLLARGVRRASRWDAIVSHWLVPCGVVGGVAARVSGWGRAGSRLPHLAIAHGGDVHLVARRGVADAVVAAVCGLPPPPQWGRGGSYHVGATSRVVFAGEHLRRRMIDAVVLPPLRRALDDTSSTCAMGIDTAAFAAARARDRCAARNALGLAPAGDAEAAVEGAGRAPVIAFLGRLARIKGVATLIDAFAQALAAHPDATLVIAGEGPERQALEARAAASPRPSAVRFTGELRAAARDALFCAADVLVVPSIDLADGRTEGTPTVALEALAAGVPLVASDAGGLRAACGEAARLVTPGDARPLAAAIVETLAERGTPAAAARAAAATRLAATHDWSQVGPRLWGFCPPFDRTR